ncbi:hypothetical protein BDY19DRAFT_106221 [Irpex rosettiformis]|uniref:Uncharacterized protein n=1 Tax=Irpex rosettiformis TaxID=378272 RepID=A0ACB8U598_9APHY|nr:hypothetical protein BDY19DRAFT_106221 [Irpex rosettiformis]
MSPKPTSILADATNTVRKGLRRMASGGLTGSERPRARGKENYPLPPPLPTPLTPFFSPIAPNGVPSAFPLPLPGTPGHARRRRGSEEREVGEDGDGREVEERYTGNLHRDGNENRNRKGSWDAVDGMIVIKVSVPCTDDIWRFKVPVGVSLRSFRRKVEVKVGFAVWFVDTRGPSSSYVGARGEGGGGWIEGGVGRKVGTEEGFRKWVEGRVGKDGRNTPLVAIPRRPHPHSTSTPQSPHQDEQPQQQLALPSASPTLPLAPTARGLSLSTPPLEPTNFLLLSSPMFPETPYMQEDNGEDGYGGRPDTPYTPYTPAMPATPYTPDFMCRGEGKQRRGMF